jgi:hypothetical protein
MNQKYASAWLRLVLSEESAIRNTVAHLVHRMLHMGLTVGEAVRIYRAAGVPVPPRWGSGGGRDRA